MTTKILFSIDIPEKFNLEEFESKFKKEFKKYGIDVLEFRKWKNDIEQPGDNADFEFKTNYDFNITGLSEGSANEQIYNQLAMFKNRFNEKSEIKLRSVLLNKILTI
ncbi:MAG: hypothetical protein E7211_08670 [Clostridium lundense]|nr:hypothetical protein [Clostridium lundense]